MFITNAKGGLSGYKYINPATYAELKKMIDQEKQFKFNEQTYRSQLKQAAQVTNQRYTGSHGLRWNFAQERFKEVQSNGGQMYDQALQTVSNELFHQRADITKHYLK